MIFNVATAREHARHNRTQEWVDAYLNTPAWANSVLSEIIRYQKPIWVGPIEVELSQLIRNCGPEEGMRYRKETLEWEQSIDVITSGLDDHSALPPLIVRPIFDKLYIPDGNHRHEALRRKGWKTAWALIWCDRDERFRVAWTKSD